HARRQIRPDAAGRHTEADYRPGRALGRGGGGCGHRVGARSCGGRSPAAPYRARPHHGRRQGITQAFNQTSRKNKPTDTHNFTWKYLFTPNLNKSSKLKWEEIA